MSKRKRRKPFSREKFMTLPWSVRKRISWQKQGIKGMTYTRFQRMRKEQEYKCKICGDKPKSLAVDHNHDTGEVRGLLCTSCNWMLGHAKDNPTTLLKAIQYLKNKL